MYTFTSQDTQVLHPVSIALVIDGQENEWAMFGVPREMDTRGADEVELTGESVPYVRRPGAGRNSGSLRFRDAGHVQGSSCKGQWKGETPNLVGVNMTDFMLPGMYVVAGILFVVFIIRWLRAGRAYEEYLQREYRDVAAERRKDPFSRMVLFPNLPMLGAKGSVNPVQQEDQNLVRLNRRATLSFICAVLALTVFPIAGKMLLRWLGAA